MNDIMPIPEQEPAKIPRPRVREDREFSRLGLASDINNVFQMIGGVPRMALWANKNPDKFFTQVLPKLLPSTSLNITGDNTKVEIVHALPATPLDDHPT